MHLPGELSFCTIRFGIAFRRYVGRHGSRRCGPLHIDAGAGHPDTDAAAKAIVKQPVAVYVEKVYEEGSFSGLGIGT